MYTTLSPCDMCTGACLLYGISRVVIGENANFLGGEAYLHSRGVEVVVVGDARCKDLMDKFIAEKPELWCVYLDPPPQPTNQPSTWTGCPAFRLSRAISGLRCDELIECPLQE